MARARWTGAADPLAGGTPRFGIGRRPGDAGKRYDSRAGWPGRDRERGRWHGSHRPHVDAPAGAAAAHATPEAVPHVACGMQVPLAWRLRSSREV